MALAGAVLVGATLALAGCGAGGRDNAAGSAAAPDSVSQDGLAEPAEMGQAEPGAAEGGAGPAKAEPARPGQEPNAPELAVNQRAIVYTGSITVRVKDVDAAAAEASGIAAGAGGFLGGDTRSSDQSGAEATLQLRVPADRFASVVDALARLGDPLRRDVRTDDVTEQTLDLDARIATQRARVESGRRLLAQAKSLSDLVMLEGELARREADLASLEAKKRRLADLTALSTITAVLLGPNARDDRDEEPSTGFLAGLKGGWKAFVASLEVLLTVLGALLPWVVALGLPALGLWWLLRRLRRRRAAPVASSGPPIASTGAVVASTSPAVSGTGPVEQPAGSVPETRNPSD